MRRSSTSSTSHAVARLREQRALPERLGQRLEAEGGEEALSVADHLDGIELLRLQALREVEAGIRIRRRDQGLDVGPLLGPHVAEQVRRDRTVRGHDVGTVLLPQPGANVGVKREVERSHLPPQTVQLGGERIWIHVVLGTPHGAEVRVAKLAGALVGQLDVAHEVGLELREGRPPPLPDIEELLGVAAARHGAAEIGEREALLARFPGGAPLAATVVALHPGCDLAQLPALIRVFRGGQHDRSLEDLDLPPKLGGQLDVVEAAGGLGVLHGLDRRPFAQHGRDGLGVLGDVGRLDPRRPRGRVVQLGEGFVGLGDEGASLLGGLGRFGDRRPREQQTHYGEGGRAGQQRNRADSHRTSSSSQTHCAEGRELQQPSQRAVSALDDARPAASPRARSRDRCTHAPQITGRPPRPTLDMSKTLSFTPRAGPRSTR